MMCNVAQRLISAYIDRELSEDDRARVRCHLATCSECSAVFESTLQLKNALASMMPASCPECLWGQVEQQIAESGLNKAGRSVTHFWSTAAAFARVVVPAAVAGAIIAVPVVQMAFGVDILGPLTSMGARGVYADAPRESAQTPDSSRTRVLTVGTGSATRSALNQANRFGFMLELNPMDENENANATDESDLVLNRLDQSVINPMDIFTTWTGGGINE